VIVPKLAGPSCAAGAPRFVVFIRLNADRTRFPSSHTDKVDLRTGDAVMTAFGARGADATAGTHRLSVEYPTSSFSAAARAVGSAISRGSLLETGKSHRPGVVPRVHEAMPFAF
jgi:hypothetical protein